MIESRSGLASCHPPMSARPPLRLSERLRRDTPLSIIRAPHGFGKSALVTDWVRSADATGSTGVLVPPPPVGVGPEGFWRLTAERLAAAGALAEAPGDDAAAYPAIRDELTRTGRPVGLALSRLDRVCDPVLEEQVVELVDLCDRLRVVVTVVGRSAFGDPFALDPTHDLLCGDDLLLRRDELGEFLAFDGALVDPDELDLVHRLTGGMWSLVEVARAVSSRLPASADRRSLLEARLAEAVSDHVRTTILAAPDVAAHREFLVATATAHTVSTETACFLDVGADADRHLAALEAAGVADRRDNASGPQWQVPAAVRRELRAMQSEDGMDPAARSTRLALHLRDRTDHAAAVRCAVEAENWPLTVELVEEHWVGLVGTELDLLRHVLLALPESVFDTIPGFREARELVASLDGYLGPDGAVVPDPEDLRLLVSADDVGKAVGIVSHQALMLRLAGRYESAADLTRQICLVVREIMEARPDDLSDLLPFLRMQWGLTYQLAGDLSESTATLRLAYLSGSARHLDYIARNAAGNSALNWALTGESERVSEWLDLERAHPPADEAIEPLIRIGGLTASALTALDRLDIASAEAALAQLDELPVIAELWPFVVYARCRHAVTTGDPFRALATLDVFADKRKRVEGEFVRSLLTAAEIESHLAAGNGSRAYLLAERTNCDTPWSVVAVARTHLITGNHQSAINTCRRYDWLGTPYTRSHLEALVIETAAQHGLGRVDRANQLWRRACELADRTGIRAAFAGVSRELVVALVAAAGKSETVAGYLAAEIAEQYPATLHRPELTDRERAVLGGLADGLSAPAIAHALFVSLSTVKSQRTSLYRKLGAHSRREALAVAREFGLLPSKDDRTGGRLEREVCW